MDILFKLTAGSILLVLFGESLFVIMYVWAGVKIEGETLVLFLLIFLGMANVHIYAYIIVKDLYKNTLINIGVCFLIFTIIFSLNPSILFDEDGVNLTSVFIFAIIPLLFTIPIIKDEIKTKLQSD